ncbi:MAG: phasin family protein [Nitrococcus mobilis]|nr:phasin family protein [Nitrococcus mobilis]
MKGADKTPTACHLPAGVCSAAQAEVQAGRAFTAVGSLQGDLSIMSEGLYTNVNALFAQFIAPARKFNSLVIENAGKFAEFQINAVYSYTDIGLKPLREALRANDVDGLQRLVTSQNEASRTLMAKLLADSQVLAGFGQDFGKEVQKLLAEEVLPSIMAAASDGAKAFAASTAERQPV